jgi:hypothetical protein
MQTLRFRGTNILALAVLALVGFGAAILIEPNHVPAQASIPPGHIVVEGRILYIPRSSGQNFPAAGLKIDIYDLDQGFPTTNQFLATATTNSSGFFRSPPIPNKDPDGPTGSLEGTQDVFLRLRSDSGDVKLLQMGTRQGYTWNSYDINPSTGLLRNVPDGVVPMQPLYIEENNKDVEALWTYIDLSAAWFFMKNQTGEEPGPITALWSPTSSQGPRYDANAREILLRSDSAGYGDVVVQQAAYALLHNILGALPADWLPCTEGPGATMQSKTTPACAFVQGFATSLALAVFDDPSFDAASTSGVNLELATAGSPGWEDGDQVPGRVAGAFWDLYEFDDESDGTDGFDATFAEVWEVIDQQRPTTMAAWWQGWLAMGKDGCLPLGSLKQNTINYNTDPSIDRTKTTIIMNEDEIRVIDLSDIVSDVECGRDKLQFRMLDPGDANLGATFTPNITLTLEPADNWFGTTVVKMEASDGATALPLDLTVIVNSVNDCPVIQPRVDDPPSVRWGNPIVIDLSGHAKDVEDQAQNLIWSVDIPPQNQGDLTATVQGSTITFELGGGVIDRYAALVTLKLTDTDGCSGTQSLKVIWDSRPNQPPFIIKERLTPEYKDCQGSTIFVDLAGVAGDDEDGPDDIEWFCDTCRDYAEFTTQRENDKQSFTFIPEPDIFGSFPIDLRVVDSGGLAARATITLTWASAAECANLPPRILRNRMREKTAGVNAQICYELSDKATDPDHPDSSLTWWMEGVNPGDLKVTGEGTQRLCLQPNSMNRRNYEGCFTTTFVVTDPFNASDKMPMQTCWRKIEIGFPFMLQSNR